MAAYQPKVYQQSVLDSVQTYFGVCHENGNDADTAFYQTTKRLWGTGSRFNSLPGFDADMPYFCLRVPTGGGKTWLAAKSISLVNTHLLRSPHSVILWLTPSKAIREQTVRALKDAAHPYHAALKEAGSINVLGLEEAMSVTRATLETSTTVIVATRQAFQVEESELRKVYESSGALIHHFEHLSPQQRDELLNDGETVPYSLANVLRLRRPFVIVDEAHNSRTELAFDTLARFRPAGIMELTATPDTTRTPSNVLHSVSAAELKAEEMIKLPILLETEPNWQQCLADAISRRNALHELAVQESRKGASYLRPIVLIQAEKRRQGIDTLDTERVKQELIQNQGIPPEEIIIATGEERGLEKLDEKFSLGIADPACPVKYVITQQALAEGWDCPSAYILVSMAMLHSSTAVEQILGRILRQPEAKHRKNKPLNQSYAFVVSRDFGETAASLRDRLVEGAGYERHEAAEFVTPAKREQAPLDWAAHPGRTVIKPVVVTLSEKPDLKHIPKTVKDKLTWDDKAKTLTIGKPLRPDEEEAIKQAVASDIAKEQITKAAEISRESVEFFQTPSEKGDVLRVPQIALIVQGELTLFDDPEVLDYPWDLSLHDAKPDEAALKALELAFKVSEGGEIDIDGETGKVTTRFIADLQRDLGLAYKPEHWDEVKLAAWLCRNLLEPSVTHASKQAFVMGWIQGLIKKTRFSLARANQQKFLIRNLLEAAIRELRLKAVKLAYQSTLFGEDKEQRVKVDDVYQFVFNPQAYAPNSDYDGRFGHHIFRHHYYSRIGDFDSGEEFECAVWLDNQAAKGRIEYWVRNLVRKEGCSFFLQKADGRFYPDFVCKLPDGVILAVEYKGKNAWESAMDDRDIGGLWESLSGGKCRFVMITDRKWENISAKL